VNGENWVKEIEAINAGSSQVELGRAREMLSHARWRAEREFPTQWGGAKVNINVTKRVASDKFFSFLLHPVPRASVARTA